MASTTTAPRLVRVASYLNSAEAEFARVLLAMDGIPAWLENAALVLWVWYYSNAVGGVKVVVPQPDAERAWTILHPPREPDRDVRPTRTCQSCNAQFDSDWTVCWRCGCTAEGEPCSGFLEPPPLVPFPLKCSPPVLAAIVGMSGPLLFLLTAGYLPLLIFWMLAVVLVLGIQSLWAGDEVGVEPSDDLPSQSDSEEEPDSVAQVAFEAAVYRAWKAAVFGMSFPPLALYSLWLMMRLDAPDAPLPPREQRRCLGALTISLIEIGLVAVYFIPW